jgi:hypothetical protein
MSTSVGWSLKNRTSASRKKAFLRRGVLIPSFCNSAIVAAGARHEITDPLMRAFLSEIVAVRDAKAGFAPADSFFVLFIAAMLRGDARKIKS